MLDAKSNVAEFVAWVRNRLPVLKDGNRFEDSAWSIEGLGAKGMSNKFAYFSKRGVNPLQHYPDGKRKKGYPAQIPEALLLNEPFLSVAKGLLIYWYAWDKVATIHRRLTAFRYLETALLEMTGGSCLTATTPEVLNRACAIAIADGGTSQPYDVGINLGCIYRYMVELGLVAVPSVWQSPIPPVQLARSRIGKQFDEERQKKLPSPFALEALAAIFNTDSGNPVEILTSSACALMLCAPDRAIEFLFAPWDLLTPDWQDPNTGEVGIGLRWFPAKGGAPMVKTVIPSMRDIAIRAVERLQSLSEPARRLAQWYEQHPDCIYLPPLLEYLRGRERITLAELQAILFGRDAEKPTKAEGSRALKWVKRHEVPYVSGRGAGEKSTVSFADIETTVLKMLPPGFPIMDSKTGMRYSEALCLARVGEFNSRSEPWQCCFERAKYNVLSYSLKTKGKGKSKQCSIFEKLNYRDEGGNFLSLTTHQLRHYLNTLVRQSGLLTEDEIAKWSGRKNVRQNTTYNHESDRDVIARLREAVGDPSRAVGPFANIDNRVFVRRDEFASIKIITAHTTEFGYCIHDYAQSPCQVHQDCINCDEQACIKGDARAEENLRSLQKELSRLQTEAQAAFSKEVLGAAEWYKYQTEKLNRVDELIAILDDPEVPEGAVIQLSGVVPPSRLAMALEKRAAGTRQFSQRIASLDDVRALLSDASRSAEESADAL